MYKKLNLYFYISKKDILSKKMCAMNIEKMQLEIERIEEEHRLIMECAQRKLTESIAYNEALENVNSELSQALSEEEHLITDENGISVRNQRNIIVTAPTQVGKTKTLIDIVKKSPNLTLTVISCDNRGDQLLQLSGRMNKAIIDNFIVSDMKFTKTGSLRKSSLEQMKHFYSKNKKLVLVLLNNNTQCSKLSIIVKELMNSMEFVKYQVFHDEADLINKDDNVNFNGPEEIAKVHKSWISHFNDIKVYPMLRQIKRIWISATPENCSLIRDIKAKDVFVLPQNIDYRKQTIFSEWKEGETKNIIKEVRRINLAGSKEVILYCSDRINTGHTTTAIELLRICKCPVVVYNGIGNIVYKVNQTPYSVNGPISEVLADLEMDYNGAVIVVGHALMSRGISFVSSTISEKSLSATVMFYSGAKSAYAVSIAQRIGRITGTSRPDITRRKVYCSQEIYNCYTNYLANQNTIYTDLQKEENKERFVADIITNDNLNIIEIGRNLDRKELKKVNAVYKESSNSSGNSSDNSLEETDKMKRLVKSWMKITNITDIAKVFRKIYNSPDSKLLSSEVKSIANNMGLAQSYVSTLYSKGPASKWYRVFSLENDMICIKTEAIEYANSL